MTPIMRAIAAASLLALALPDAAHAVSLAQRGTGQVLLFPYYSANDGNQTLLTIVNTRNRAKAVRVRFNEARNGRPVYELSLYLGPFDSWVGAVFDSPTSGATSLVTIDPSCSLPALAPLAPAAFRREAYTGVNRDHPEALAAELGTTARLREGYVEVIEMGELETGSGPLQLAEEVTPSVTTGLPPACAAIAAAWSGGWATNPAQGIALPRGGLVGTSAIVDVAAGTMLAVEPTVLADFYVDITAPGALHFPPEVSRPDLADARSQGDVVRVERMLDDGTPQTETFPAGARSADAVSLLLQQLQLQNEFTIEPALGARTEWVVTFPTKRYYTDVAADGLVPAPFRDAFRDDGRSEHLYSIAYWDRRGVRSATVGCDTLCGLPPEGGPAFANAVNAILWSATSATGSTPILGAPIGATAQVLRPTLIPDSQTPVFENGSADMLFDDPRNSQFGYRIVPASGRAYRGLPVIGFAATQFINANAQPGVIANYAGASAHRTSAFVLPAGAPVAAREDQQ